VRSVFFPQIHMLRAIAVVAAHQEFELGKVTGPSTDLMVAKIGPAGVDIFFVISGFIMVQTSHRWFGTAGAAADFLVGERPESYRSIGSLPSIDKIQNDGVQFQISRACWSKR
jgi:hypothetical protein